MYKISETKAEFHKFVEHFSISTVLFTQWQVLLCPQIGLVHLGWASLLESKVLLKMDLFS